MSWRPIALVFIGGASGTCVRAVVEPLVPDIAGFPAGIVAINILGSFLLGALLPATRRGRLTKSTGPLLRLLLGTGFLGGFTSYSTFALSAGGLVDSGMTISSLILAIPTVVAGMVAAALGRLIVGRSRTLLSSTVQSSPREDS